MAEAPRRSQIIGMGLGGGLKCGVLDDRRKDARTGTLSADKRARLGDHRCACETKPCGAALGRAALTRRHAGDDEQEAHKS